MLVPAYDRFHSISTNLVAGKSVSVERVVSCGCGHAQSSYTAGFKIANHSKLLGGNHLNEGIRHGTRVRGL